MASAVFDWTYGSCVFFVKSPGIRQNHIGDGPVAIYDFAEAPTTYEKHTPSGQEKTALAILIDQEKINRRKL